MATYKKLDNNTLEVTKDAVSSYSVENIKHMIEVWQTRSDNALAEKAKWETLLTEAGKVGIKTEEEA
jgi:hypothetical protein